MFIPDHTIEEVRAASDIVEVVGDYVRLKKRGTNYVGLCPFHNEKTPSFNVNPSIGIFKCFGCGVGGDVFQFVMRTEHVGFLEAVRALAERGGIPLPEPGGAENDQATASEPVYHALRFAARFFFDQLTQAEQGKRGLDYLRRRGITGATIKRFGVGYAPDAWDALLLDAEKNHVSPEVLEKAGLTIRRKEGEGHYDRYRDRVIFPIFSHVGKVLGFGGRVLDTGTDQPKYINSPETEVYSKSQVLYGLYHGKQAIRRAEEAILVEGYTDVISLQQAGIENVVAVCGTSLTEKHVRNLSRYARRIIFLNDSDAAGENATVRGVGLALSGGLTPYVVELPEGEDPDSFAQKNEREDVETYLRENRWTFVQYMLYRARRDGRLERPEEETKALHEVLALIASITDPLARDAYVREMSKVLDKPDMLLYGALEKLMAGIRQRSAGRERSRRQPSPAEQTEYELDESARSGAETTDVPVLQSAEPLPEELILVRVMLEHGLPLVEFVLGNMALEEFTEGPVRETMLLLIQQYQEDKITKEPFLDGTHGDAIQNLVSGVFIDEFEVSVNWARKKIAVPRQNEDPYKAAAGAIKFLRMDRIQQDINTLELRHYHLSRDSDECLEVGLELLKLKTRFNEIEKDGIAVLEQR